MTESTSAVRADIEATRARMSSAITELEKKVDVGQKVRDNPWPALALAFGAGLALSASGADVRTGKVSLEAAQKTGGRLGTAFDDILATALAGVTATFQGHLEDAMKDLMSAVKGKAGPADGAARQLASASVERPVYPDARMTQPAHGAGMSRAD